MKYLYMGKSMLTRGDCGVRVSGAHDGVDPENPRDLFVFDPDFGERFVCTAERATEGFFVSEEVFLANRFTKGSFDFLYNG